MSETTRLAPVAGAFVAFGMFTGAWAVVTADIEHTLKFGNGAFGLLLAAALTGSMAMNAAVGPLTERHGTSTSLAVALAIWAGGLVLLAVAPAPWGLCAAVVVVLSVAGAVDVAMNVAATAALAGHPGRLVRFHGLFNVGAMAGAGAAALVLRAGDSWRTLFGGLVVVAVALAIWTSRVHLPAGGAGESHGPLHGLRTVRAEHLIGLALVFACGAMVEGGIGTWGVLVLRDRLGVAAAVGALGYLVGQLVAAGTRGGLGPTIGRHGAVRGLAIGGGATAIGLGLLALAPAPGAVIGLAVAAGGISVCWPLLLAQASDGRDRPGVVVGGVSAIGYFGIVVGPPIVGGLASLFGLRPAMLLLAFGGLVVAAGPLRLAHNAAARSAGLGADAPST
ncbi:MAG TPA: MFS transporter [Acidimicrobiales bacterium]